MKAKLVSLSVVAVMTFSLAAQSFAAVTPFTDLGNGKSKEKIIALQVKGVVKGIGNNKFAPDAVVTAAQGMQFLVNALGLNLDLVKFEKEPKATDYFVKADNKAWYANASITAAVNGLGFTKELDPNQEWTREEFTYQLVKAMELHFNLPMIKLVPAKITDEDQLTIDYSGAIQRALHYGMVQLDAKGNFSPKSKMTRAEAADEVYNMLEYMKAHPAPKQ